MKRPAALIAGLGAFFVLLAVSSTFRALDSGHVAAADDAAIRGLPDGLTTGSLYGRITLEDGEVLEGPIRLGGNEEALWNHQFNGARQGNMWADRVPEDQLPTERMEFTLFGLDLGWNSRLSLKRPFMARFGDIDRIDSADRGLRVTLRSGSEFELDRFGSDDLGDQITIRDSRQGTVNVGEWKVVSIEFLSPAGAANEPIALAGTVRSTGGDFTGLIQWDRELALTTDAIEGMADGHLVEIAFGEVRSITRTAEGNSRVQLKNGETRELTGTRNVGTHNRGVYVDDPRFGRVLVTWDAFLSVEMGKPEAGPSRNDFSIGRVLTGTVVSRAGSQLTGRIVFDLDESETTETLDAAADGVHYNIPFGMIASIRLPAASGDRGETSDPTARAVLELQTGDELELGLNGDLQWTNGGILIFGDDPARPDYLPWAEVDRIDLTENGGR